MSGAGQALEKHATTSMVITVSTTFTESTAYPTAINIITRTNIMVAVYPDNCGLQ
jgi:outer membrane receptor for ferrienterochelin and colicin